MKKAVALFFVICTIGTTSLFAVEWPSVYRVSPGIWAVDYDGTCYNLRFAVKSVVNKTVEILCDGNVRTVGEFVLSSAISSLLQSAGLFRTAADYAADKLASYGYSKLCD
jgi:hypothetical protein